MPPSRPEYDVHVDALDDLDVRTAYLLWALRESVFVVEQDCAYPELDGRDLEPGTRHVWMSVEGAPVGYLRILDDDSHLRIGRVLVAGPHRGRGFAAVLLRAALEVVGDRPSRLDAQSRLARWYSGFGYRQQGAEFVEDGIAHIPMVRDAAT